MSLMAGLVIAEPATEEQLKKIEQSIVKLGN